MEEGNHEGSSRTGSYKKSKTRRSAQQPESTGEAKCVREHTVAIPLRCRRPRCQRLVYARGLCGSCYSMAYRLVKDDVTSWARLRRAGKIDEPKRDAKEWLLDEKESS